MEQKHSLLSRKIRLDIADSIYSDLDTEKSIKIFKDQQKSSLLIQQYVKNNKQKDKD